MSTYSALNIENTRLIAIPSSSSTSEEAVCHPASLLSAPKTTFIQQSPITSRKRKGIEEATAPADADRRASLQSQLTLEGPELSGATKTRRSPKRRKSSESHVLPVVRPRATSQLRAPEQQREAGYGHHADRAARSRAAAPLNQRLIVRVPPIRLSFRVMGLDLLGHAVVEAPRVYVR
ncbi:hypothetical protein L226DRAFT_561628 [Lentinus tigrinus ALCF2SS1-7]|uniref:uncharacterized protein n=1 Tax=Lentinus tigrinus ALCF2SS1-7 TaxID=1328758 RepID=UPI0011660C1D|nr:hypothetical protein L226DRAFT_561628 [Lentinus tigrinus ALCF2SS1-7]